MTACRECGAEYEPGMEPDPCVGYIPGLDVVSACCGHGNADHALVIFGDPPERTRLTGADALRWLSEQTRA